MYRVTLPEGIIDYARNIPSRELILVAPAANLVVSSELHPALVDLLIQSAAEIHGGGGGFGEAVAFGEAATLGEFAATATVVAVATSALHCAPSVVAAG